VLTEEDISSRSFILERKSGDILSTGGILPAHDTASAGPQPCRAKARHKSLIDLILTRH
jgi:hypothetical protein